MTRRGIRLALTAALFVVLAPAAAMAQTGTIVDWGPDSYAWEPGYNHVTHLSVPGAPLNAVGIVNDFAGPLAGLEPVPAGTEYTYWITNLVAGVTSIAAGPTLTTYRTVYTTTSPGADNLFIYRSPTNASFGINPPNATAPSTFNDGQLILSGRFQSLTVTVVVQNSNNTVLTGNADSGTPSVANGVFTGGSEFGRVSINRVGCPFRVTGGWLAKPGNFPTGYSAHFDGKLDIDCPTPASSSTWGRIKEQYR
jgi:hypothetical protein